MLPYFDPEYENFNQRINPPRVCIDNTTCSDCTLVKVDSMNKNGILLEVLQVLSDLDLHIFKAYITSDGGWFMDVFHVVDKQGHKVTDDKTIKYIEKEGTQRAHVSAARLGRRIGHWTAWIARTEVPAAAAAVERSGRMSPSPPSRAPRSGRTPAPSRAPRLPVRRAVDPGNADPSRDLSTDVQEALDAAPLDPARCAIRTARDTARRPDQGSTPPSPPAHRISTSPGGCWAARLPPLRRTAPGVFGGWLGALAPGAQAWTCVLQVQLKSCSGRQGASGT